MINSFPTTDSFAVIPIVSPTVPNAEMTSNITARNGKSGSAITSANVIKKINVELNTTIAKLLNKYFVSIAFLNKLICSRCFIKLIVPKNITTAVVSFIPPAVGRSTTDKHE